MTRVRVFKNARTMQHAVETEYSASGAVIKTSTSSAWEGPTDTMYDVVTKGYQALSAKGRVLNKPMTRIKSELFILANVALTVQQQTRNSATAPWKNGSRWTTTGQLSLVGAEKAPWELEEVKGLIDKVEALALTDAFAEAGKADVEALVSAAELPETLAFMYSPVRKAIHMVQRFRGHKRRNDRRQARYNRAKARYDSWPPGKQARRKPPEPPEFASFQWGKFSVTDVASYWLAFRYGIMPLAYEIQDWHGYFTKVLADRPQRETSRGKASERFTDSSDDTRRVWTERTRTNTVNCDVKARAGVLYELGEPTITNDLGLGLHRLPAAAYELIPLSFVADWFGNQAAYYDACTVNFRVKRVLSAWVTTTVAGQAHTWLTRAPSWESTTERITVSPSGIVNHQSHEYEWKRRSPRALSDIAIHSRVKLNWKRHADGLALLSTLIGSLARKR